MCVVSYIGDRYRDDFYKKHEWFPKEPQKWPDMSEYEKYLTPAPTMVPTLQQFNELKAEVEELKKLLKAAQEFDAKTGQPHCEQDEKIEFIKKIAEFVGVDLKDLFEEKKPQTTTSGLTANIIFNPVPLSGTTFVQDPNTAVTYTSNAANGIFDIGVPIVAHPYISNTGLRANGTNLSISSDGRSYDTIVTADTIKTVDGNLYKNKEGKWLPFTQATEENWPGDVAELYASYNLHHPGRTYKFRQPPKDYPVGDSWYDEANTD